MFRVHEGCRGPAGYHDRPIGRTRGYVLATPERLFARVRYSSASTAAGCPFRVGTSPDTAARAFPRSMAASRSATSSNASSGDATWMVSVRSVFVHSCSWSALSVRMFVFGHRRVRRSTSVRYEIDDWYSVRKTDERRTKDVYSKSESASRPSSEPYRGRRSMSHRGPLYPRAVFGRSVDP